MYPYKSVIKEILMTNTYIFLGQKFSFNLVSVDDLRGGSTKPLKLYVNFAGVFGGAVFWGKSSIALTRLSKGA